jgi:hypothetical protein
MTTWTSITNAQTDQDSPVTQTLMQALRDNVPATAEGATNSPVMVSGWHPYDMVNVSDGNDGKVYDFSVDGAVTALEITIDAGFEYRVVFHDIAHNSGASNRSFLVDVYQANAASYANLLTSTNTGTTGDDADGWFDLYHPRLTASNYASMQGIVGFSSGTDLSAHAAIGTSEYVSKLRLRFSSDDSWKSGVVYVYRRQFFA